MILHKHELTPREIVAELDKHVIGQQDAKRSVAIALRNRWRRKQVSPHELQEEIYPHNILMVGPTGVGKTEIARRLAKLVDAPFIKVEATKFTEVGYVGRDVDSIIRDLVDIAIKMTKERMRKKVESEVVKLARERVITALVGETASADTRDKFMDRLLSGDMNDTEIEIEVADNPAQSNSPFMDIPGMPGGQIGMINIGDMLSKALGGAKTKRVKMKVKDAIQLTMKEEAEKLIDEESAIAESIKQVENDGIVFLDEVDKICSRSGENSGRGEVSREGVQRDLLPLIEGTTVTTKYGFVKTDHILFIASGAFHLAKPSDLLPELQGRLPIRVELQALSQDDLCRILTEPKASLIKQYKALFAVEQVELNFKEDGIAEIAEIASSINKEVENIGARRLHTILEKLLEGINFTASETPGIKVNIDKDYVRKHLSGITHNTDLSKFIL